MRPGTRRGWRYAFRSLVLGLQFRRSIVREEIFRIAREALLNAFQHAKAVKVEVELTYSRRTICLRIRDDGAGIRALNSPAAVQDTGAYPECGNVLRRSGPS